MPAERFIESTQSYMGEAFKDFGPLVDKFRQCMKENNVRYDTLVGTGLSGSLVVPHLARRLKKSWAIVRKGNDGSHSSNPVEGRLGKRWVFVDDFVASGRTRQRVLDAVAEMIQSNNDVWDWTADRYRTKENPFATSFLGTYEYEPAKFDKARPSQLATSQKKMQAASDATAQAESVVQCTCELCQRDLDLGREATKAALAAAQAPGGWGGWANGGAVSPRKDDTDTVKALLSPGFGPGWMDETQRWLAA